VNAQTHPRGEAAPRRRMGRKEKSRRGFGPHRDCVFRVAGRWAHRHL